MSQNPATDDAIAFSCRTEDAKPFVSVLTGLSSGKHSNVQVLVRVLESGLSFVVTDPNKGMQGVGYLADTNFVAYNLTEPTEFRVSLADLLACMLVFGASTLDSTAVALNYHSEGGWCSLLL